MEISLTVIAAILSTLFGSILPLLKRSLNDLRKAGRGERFFASDFGRGLSKILEIEKPLNSPDELFGELFEASKRMDAAVAKIQDFTRGREQAVRKLETDLGMLTSEEQRLQKRISELKNVPLPAAEYFATLVHKGERHSAMRDYGLFTAGVIVSAVVTVILKRFGLA